VQRRKSCRVVKPNNCIFYLSARKENHRHLPHNFPAPRNFPGFHQKQSKRPKFPTLPYASEQCKCCNERPKNVRPTDTRTHDTHHLYRVPCVRVCTWARYTPSVRVCAIHFSVEYDMHMGLLELLKIFLARNPSADPTLPEVQLSNCVRIVSMMCTRLHPNHPR
jgi:hypothetical protein